MGRSNKACVGRNLGERHARSGDLQEINLQESGEMAPKAQTSLQQARDAKSGKFILWSGDLQVINLQESGHKVPKVQTSLQQARDAKCAAVVKALTDLNLGSGADIQTFLEGVA